MRRPQAAQRDGSSGEQHHADATNPPRTQGTPLMSAMSGQTHRCADRMCYVDRIDMSRVRYTRYDTRRASSDVLCCDVMRLLLLPAV
jgi:hypothetical protein